MKTKTVDFQRFLDAEKNAKEALRLASKHDPDLEKRIKHLEFRLDHLSRKVK
jgi:hypothetical protein